MCITRLGKFILSLCLTALCMKAYADTVLTVTPVTPVFRTSNDLRLKVTIENTQRPCRPVVLDDLLTPFKYSQRGVQLLLQVTDANGRVIAGAPRIPPAVAGLVAADAIVLDCDQFFGAYIRPATPVWGYRLAPGKYRLKATLLSRMRTLALRDSKFIAKLSERLHLQRDTVMSYVLDGSVESAQVTFEIIE